LDGTDNLQSRLLLNEHARKRKVPFVSCAAVETRGMVMTVLPEGACLNCLLGGRRSEEDCESFGVINAATQLAASVQTAEALKILVGAQPTRGVMSFDVWTGRYDVLAIARTPSCAVCSGRFDRLDGQAPLLEYCSSRRAVKVRPTAELALDFARLKSAPGVELIEAYGTHAMRLRFDGCEILAFADGGLEIRTRDADHAAGVAERLYRRSAHAARRP
jgi:adenylyltransferase/sulfurtransferase